MPDERRRVTLTKVQCESPVGGDLIALLTELSSDGVVSRDEFKRLRAWLEVDRGVDFPALPFLYEVIDQVSSDGDITEDELDRLALAIERVLPKEVRDIAAAKRKQALEARRIAQREAARQTMIAQRAEKRAVRDAARARGGSSTRRISQSEAPSVSPTVERRASGSCWATSLRLSESQRTLTMRTQSWCLETAIASSGTCRGRKCAQWRRCSMRAHRPRLAFTGCG